MGGLATWISAVVGIRLSAVSKRGAPLADDQHPLVDEVLRIDRDVGVVLRQIDARDLRHVGLAGAGRHDQPLAGEDVASRVGEPELPRVGPLDAQDAGVAADVEPVELGVVGEVAHELVGAAESSGGCSG